MPSLPRAFAAADFDHLSSILVAAVCAAVMQWVGGQVWEQKRDRNNRMHTCQDFKTKTGINRQNSKLP